MPAVASEYIDRLVTVEARFGSGIPRGVVHALYAAARAAQGEPLTHLAARRLASAVKPGDYVVFVTGAGAGPHLPSGETDGPIGAACLARALAIGLGAKPVVVTEPHHVAPIRAAFEAAGFPLMPDEWVQARRRYAAAFRTLPGDLPGDTKVCEEVMTRFRPAAIIFIEKIGVNEKGVFHSVNGTGRRGPEVANAHLFVDMAPKHNALTIGIGDGGNEIGCAIIADATRQVQPYGRCCRCGCGGGIATVVPCDVLVIAAISNWGAYGIAASLAIEKRDPSILHDEETERRMLARCVEAGAFDGAYAAPLHSVDGASEKAQLAVVTLLREIVDNALLSFDRGF